MTIKSILVPLTGTSNTAALRAALSLAKAFNAHIEMLQAVADPDSLMSELLPEAGLMEIYSELASEANRQLETTVSICRKTVGNAAVEWLDQDEIVDAPSATLKTVAGVMEQLLPERALVSDLIVMNFGTKERQATYNKLLRAALFKTGRPVLLVPEIETLSLPPRKVVFAWNGSFEAARALRLSLPLLKDAHVQVYTGVEGDVPGISAREVVIYLRHHGIRAEAREEFLNQPCDIAVRNVVDNVGADLLVMGAYSRSERVRETLLGSLTGEILKEMDVPVLMVN